MKSYQQLSATTEWAPFSYKKKTYSLAHLNVHEVTYAGEKETFKFVVTYGLHCFAKDNEPTSIDVDYNDTTETRKISLERYQASLQLRTIVEGFTELKFGETVTEKFFCIQLQNSATGQLEPYKICFVLFKENRLMRMHITSAFFDRESKEHPPEKYSIWKLAMDLKKRPKSQGVPKEATRGTRQKQKEK